MRTLTRSAGVAAAALLLGSCLPAQGTVVRLVTTTSVYDSGLLSALIPVFESSHAARVDVLAVGSGQALALAERGDADLLLVHDPAAEQAFLDAGNGLERFPLMWNEFVLVGPPDDPAGSAQAESVSQGFRRIADARSLFLSRGDNSGTHSRERQIWERAGITPEGESWYAVLGQGMGETLTAAAEVGGYTLSDRGTFLALQGTLSDLEILLPRPGRSGIDPDLLNAYSLITIDPERHPGTQSRLAEALVEWLLSDQVQQRIADFGVDRFGEPLFFPSYGQDPAAGP
jgi:tungstate transport system substrate-binding protein